MSEKLTTKYDILDRNVIERIGLTKEDLDIILKASLEMARQEVSIDEGIEIIKYGKMLDPIYGEDGCAVCRPKDGEPVTIYNRMSKKAPVFRWEMNCEKYIYCFGILF